MKWKNLGIAFCGGAAIGALFFLQNVYIYHFNHEPLSNLYIFLFDVTGRSMWAVLAFPIYWVVRHNRIENCSWVRLALIHTAGPFVFGYFQQFATGILLWGLMFVLRQPPRPLFEDQSFVLAYFNMFFYYYVVVSLCYGIDFYQREKEQQSRSVRLEARLAQTNFDAVRMRLDPQMLLGTFDTITMWMKKDLEAADMLIEKLGDYLRLLLEDIRHSHVFLDREIATTLTYLDLCEMRSDRRFAVRWDLDPGTLKIPVPDHAVRRIFEALIKSGKWAEQTEVSVASRVTGGVLELEIAGSDSALAQVFEPSGFLPEVEAFRQKDRWLLRLASGARLSDSDFPEFEPDPRSTKARRPSRRSRLTRAERWWLLNFVCWTTLSLIFFWRLFLLMKLGGGQMDLWIVLWYSARWLVWALFTPWILFWVERHPLKRGQLRATLPVFILQCIGMWIVLLSFDLMLNLAWEGHPGEAIRIALSNFQFTGDSLTYWSIVLFGHAVVWHNRWHDENTRAGRLQAQLIQARLTALKMQLHPHFLFNALNSVSELMRQNVDAAREMILKIKCFLSLTLESSAVDQVTVTEELEFLRSYLAIQQVRFQDQLKVSLDIEEATREIKVPNLILQPIVENAIRYGVSRKNGQGRIRIHTERAHGRLRMEVEDNGPGLQWNFQEGLGLSNTRERLKHSYGEAYRLEYQDVPDGGMKVTMEIPAIGER